LLEVYTVAVLRLERYFEIQLDVGIRKGVECDVAGGSLSEVRYYSGNCQDCWCVYFSVAVALCASVNSCIRTTDSI
jgi:hypothetical protein